VAPVESALSTTSLSVVFAKPSENEEGGVMPRLAFTRGAGLPVAGVGDTRLVRTARSTLTRGLEPRSPRCEMSVVVLLPEDSHNSVMLAPPTASDS
jgi:hypothetical protein